MKRVGLDFWVYVRKDSVELLDSIPSVDCREVRGVFDIRLEKVTERGRVPY